MIHTFLSTELGVTPRCAVLIALTWLTLALAVAFGGAALYGSAAVIAFVAGTTWGRTLHCDTCHASLEDER